MCMQVKMAYVAQDGVCERHVVARVRRLAFVLLFHSDLHNDARIEVGRKHNTQHWQFLYCLVKLS